MTGNFFDLVDRLIKANVDFVIVGGFAGIVYGCTYMTQDIAICCDFAPVNLLLLQEAVSGLHPVHRMTPSRKKLELTEKNCGQFKNLYLDTDMGQLDCLSYINGVGDYQKVRQASIVVQSGETKLRVLNFDALLEAKKAMNRPRDQEAIRQLEAIKALQKAKTK